MKTFWQRRFQLTLLLAVVTGTGPAAWADDTGYYVDNGREITYVDRGDRPRVMPREWQIRLYRLGDSPGGRNNWGMITGKTVVSVMKQLKNMQTFEKQYARWCRCGQEKDTYFNYLGPIARFTDSPAATTKDYAKFLDDANTIADRTGVALTTIDYGRQSVKLTIGVQTSAAGVSTEYFSLLNDALNRTRTIYTMLDTLPLGNVSAMISATQTDIKQFPPIPGSSGPSGVSGFVTPYCWNAAAGMIRSCCTTYTTETECTKAEHQRSCVGVDVGGAEAKKESVMKNARAAPAC